MDGSRRPHDTVHIMKSQNHAGISDYEYHYRYGADKMAPWRRVLGRTAFELFFQGLAIREYGGHVLPTSCSRGYYVGRELYDWVGLASFLDKPYRALGDQMRSDFGISRSRLHKIFVVIISDAVGVAELARRLELQRRYDVRDGQTYSYFWHDRAVFASGLSDTSTFEQGFHRALIWALCHQYLGATWPSTWAIDGYAPYLASRVFWPPGAVDRNSLFHLIQAVRAEKARPLRELVALTQLVPEDRLSERAYNEQAYYFVNYLHAQAEEIPGAWDVVRAHISREIWSGEAAVARLEKAFRISIDAVERAFLEWCQSKLGSAQE